MDFIERKLRQVEHGPLQAHVGIAGSIPYALRGIPPDWFTRIFGSIRLSTRSRQPNHLLTFSPEPILLAVDGRHLKGQPSPVRLNVAGTETF